MGENNTGTLLLKRDTYKENHLPYLTSISRRYQWLLTLYISLFWVIGLYCFEVVPFVFMNPIFEKDGVQITELQACKDITNAKIMNPYTAVGKNYLYCEREGEREIIQSAFWMGSVAGVFVMPILAQIIGRRKGFILLAIIGLMASVILFVGVLIDSTFLTILGNVGLGFMSNAITPLSLIAATQYFSDKMRQTASMAFMAFWPLAELSFIAIDQFLKNWDEYVIYTIIIPMMAALLISMFFLIESPSFALNKLKNLDKYRQSTEMMAIYNRIDFAPIAQEIDKMANKETGYDDFKCNGSLNSQETIELEQAVTKQKEVTLIDSLKILLRNRRNLIFIICFSLQILAFGLFYFGVQCSVERFGYSFGFTMFFLGLFQFFSYFSAGYFIHKVPRKKGMIISEIVTGCLGLCFIFSFVADSKIIQTLLAGVSRTSVTYAYSFIIIALSQSFSPKVVSNAITVIIGTGQLSKLIIPLLIATFQDLGIQPVIICSILYLLGIIPIMFVKETLKK